MRYLLILMDEESYQICYPTHAYNSPRSKKQHWVLVQKKMRYDTYSLASNIEEISYKVIIESNRLLQSETVSKNNRAISKGNYTTTRHGYIVSSLNSEAGYYRCIKGSKFEKSKGF